MNTTPINLQEEYAKTEIAKILNLLDEELVGLAPVKSRIREIAALLLIDKLRKNRQLRCRQVHRSQCLCLCFHCQSLDPAGVQRPQGM